MFPKLRYFIPLAIAITLLCGLIYLTGQQILRQDANDPQIQMAEDIAKSLSRGEQPNLPESINLQNSLAPFVMTFDKEGKVVMSTATVNGQTPPLPSGVLNATTPQSESHLTWQPAHDVRIAAVISRYNGLSSGFVLAGRSLREVEKRESNLLLLVTLGWGVTILASLIATFLILPSSPKQK